MNDKLKRLGWTVVAALPGNLTAALIFDAAAWKALVATAIIAAINGISLIARDELAKPVDA